jgi:predicted nuclease of predicted toxin-antitoxin system
MRFLIDANMPRSTAESLKRYDHEAVDVRDIGMGSAADSEIAAYAQQNRLALVTRDFDFADIRNYPPAQYAGLLVLELPDDAMATFVLRDLVHAVDYLPGILRRLTGDVERFDKDGQDIVGVIDERVE